MSNSFTRDDVLTWFREDDEWEGIRDSSNLYKDTSDMLLRHQSGRRGMTLPAGLRVFLHILPTLLLFGIVVGVHFAVVDRSPPHVSTALDEESVQLLHKYPELFVVQNTEWSMDEGRVVYSVPTEVMQGLIQEVRDSQEYYRILTLLLLCVFIVAVLRLLLVCVWSLLSLSPNGSPEWLDRLI